MSQKPKPGVETFWQVLCTPGTRVVALPLQNCQEEGCTEPIANVFVVHVPSLQTTGHTLGAAFFCQKHSNEIIRRLEAYRKRMEN